MAYVARSRALLALVRARREEAFAAFRAEQRHDALLTAHSLPPFVRAQMMLVQS